jgi:hypothetical protein
MGARCCFLCGDTGHEANCSPASAQYVSWQSAKLAKHRDNCTDRDKFTFLYTEVETKKTVVIAWPLSLLKPNE